MEITKPCILLLLALFLVFNIVPGEAGNAKSSKKNLDAASTNYEMLSPTYSGQEQARCLARGACHGKTLVCPAECPKRKPVQNRKQKACFLDCSSKCEVTCKRRIANCNGYGSLCYDPRFIGGDGVMFYFHGEKGGTFAIVSDNNLQINAHFIGTRPVGRKRDFTWVQALSIMFETHTLEIAAKKVSHWDKESDHLIVKWNGVEVQVPMDGEAEWVPNSEELETRAVVVERTDELNNVRVSVSGLVQIDIKVRPIGKMENLVHKYQIPKNDAFAHLETQFKFFDLSDLVEGVLGKTYRPDYVSPVKRGVAMPMMGGEDKYKTPSLYSAKCDVCMFERPTAMSSIVGLSQI
ncbi:hypothetical protein ACFE04_012946 [Oxalis oulophora]